MSTWTAFARCVADGCGWEWRVRLPSKPATAVTDDLSEACERQGDAHQRQQPTHTTTVGMEDESKLPKEAEPA